MVGRRGNTVPANQDMSPGNEQVSMERIAKGAAVVDQGGTSLWHVAREVLLTNNQGKGLMALRANLESLVGDASRDETLKIGKTLQLFAQGTWHDYVANQDSYMELDDALCCRLKCLTVVTMCAHRKYVNYDLIQNMIDVDCIHELESLLIHHCIYSGLICGTLDQKRQCLNVSSAIPRDVSPDILDGMIQSLDLWLDQAQKVACFLEEQTDTIGTAVEKSAMTASYKEQQLQEASRKVSLEKSKKVAADTQGASHLISLPSKESHGSRLKKTRRQ